jgi:uncharacterized membrane protein YccF (DUF307 family)
MRIIGNLLWLVLSGIEMAIAYVVAGMLSVLFIVTIPLAVPAFRLAGYSLWPFGRVVVRRESAGAGSTIGTVIWFIVAGWWLALLHVLFGLLLAITIIGIPFALVHLKLAGLAPCRTGRTWSTLASPTARTSSSPPRSPSEPAPRADPLETSFGGLLALPDGLVVPGEPPIDVVRVADGELPRV